MAELTAPLVYKNEEKRIVYGPVLVPDEPDTDNDVVTAEQIENVAHKFVEEYGNIDLMHSLNNVGRLVESYILPVDLEVDEDTLIPKGSWIMGVRVTDDDAWQAVKDGKLGGFSIMALQKTAIKSAEKDNQESKRVTLSDLGDDWIVNAVSLVDEPAVPKAKWIAIKSKSKDNTDINIDINSEVVKKAVDGSLEHRKCLLDHKLESMFANYERYPVIHSTLIDSVIFRIHDDRGTQKTFQVGYQLDENGNVEFTEEPKEVRIEENVVPIENLLASTNSKDAQNENNERTEGFMARFMKSIGLRPKTSEKAGKTISDANLKKLRQAKEAIDELLAIGEKERQGEKNKKNSKEQKGAEKMNKEEVQALIDEKIEPINSKLDDVLKAMKQEAKGEEQKGDETQTSEKSKGDDKHQDEKEVTNSKDDQEQDDYKEKYETVLKQLENRPFSHRLAGQDGVEKSKDDEPIEDRNAFGYKRN